MSLNVKPLTRELRDRFKDSFDCGNSRLNEFFKGPESLDIGIGLTYVLLTEDESALLGYYNLTTGMINEADNPRNRIGGAIHINCFALDNGCHGLLQDYDKNGNPVRLSDVFFSQCIETILSFRDKVGFTFITLSSTKEGYSLYKRAMFENLDDDMFIAEKEMEQNGSIPMYYPIDLEE